MLVFSAGGLALFEYLKPTKLEEHTYKEGSQGQQEDDKVPSASLGPTILNHYQDISYPGGAPSDAKMKEIRAAVLSKHKNHADDYPIAAAVKQFANSGETQALKEDIKLWSGVVGKFDQALSYILPGDKPSDDVKQTT